VLACDVPVDEVSPGVLYRSACAIVHLRSVVAGQPLSLAQAHGVLIVRHGRPVVGGVVMLPVVSRARTEEVRGDVDHSGGLTVNRSSGRPRRRKVLGRAANT
jgi:hypothetical protein